MIKKVESRLVKLIAQQSQPGLYDYDAYAHGLANGLILALSLFEIEDGTPRNVELLEAPKAYGRDAQNNADTVCNPGGRRA